MDYICNDNISHIVHRPVQLLTHCPLRYDPGDEHVDFDHRCADSNCVGYVFEYAVEEDDSGCLGDATFLCRKGHTLPYEEPLDEQEKEQEQEELESESDSVSEVIWPDMTDDEIRKAERKRVNRH
jgi:hypothetical protein